MSELNENLDKGIEKFEHYNSVLEHYQNIISIVGKDSLGIDNSITSLLRETEMKNSLNMLNASRVAMETNRNLMERAEIELAKA
jgi:predicted amino acid-binding ACT domain protein